MKRPAFSLPEILVVVAIILVLATLTVSIGWWVWYRFEFAERAANWDLHTADPNETLYEDLLDFDPNEPIYYNDWVQRHKERAERRKQLERNKTP